MNFLLFIVEMIEYFIWFNIYSLEDESSATLNYICSVIPATININRLVAPFKHTFPLSRITPHSVF